MLGDVADRERRAAAGSLRTVWLHTWHYVRDAEHDMRRYLDGQCGVCDAYEAPLLCECGEPVCSDTCLSRCAYDAHAVRGMGQAPAEPRFGQEGNE